MSRFANGLNAYVISLFDQLDDLSEHLDGPDRVQAVECGPIIPRIVPTNTEMFPSLAPDVLYIHGGVIVSRELVRMARDAIAPHAKIHFPWVLGHVAINGLEPVD